MTLRKVPPIRKLRTTVQSSKRHRTEWHYTIHRKISIYFTWTLLHTGITANQVSLFSMASGLAGAVFLLLGDRRFAILGLLSFYGYFLLDKVDGEIARYRRQESLRGICLDYIGHLAIPPPSSIMCRWVFGR